MGIVAFLADSHGEITAWVKLKLFRKREFEIDIRYNFPMETDNFTAQDVYNDTTVQYVVVALFHAIPAYYVTYFM